MTRGFEFPKSYGIALRKHLAHDSAASLKSARLLGKRAIEGKFTTLDIAKIHERILITTLLPDCKPAQRASMIRRAANFFAYVMAPIELSSQSEWATVVRLKKSIAELGQRTVELSASNLELSQEIAQRTAAQEALRSSERRYMQLLKQSDQQQIQLRQLSRQIILAQEDERRSISRELHDVIAQTLTGINIRLSALKKTANLNTKDLDRSITRTQLLVVKSVDIIHRFARELRPAVLDDLGLIPALHAYMKAIAGRSGFRAQLNAVVDVESLEPTVRTPLVRVAQGALINIGRHSHAGTVKVSITHVADEICLTIHDDGRSFAVERIFAATGGKHLGLIGMRERMEMVGGSFAITSEPGRGTTITAKVPLLNAREAKQVSGSQKTRRVKS